MNIRDQLLTIELTPLRCSSILNR